MHIDSDTITVVVPVYNEESNLDPLLRELVGVVETLPAYSWRFVFVDDGSTDGSVGLLLRKAEIDPRIRIIALSRNFGKEVALTAGLDSVERGAVIFMDADLQHPPALIPELVKRWEEGAEVVATVRKSIANRPFLKRLGSRVFYALINRLGESAMIPNGTDFRLLAPRVVALLQGFTERTRMLRGLVDWMGLSKSMVEFEAPDRIGGNVGYGYRKLFRLAVDSFTSFSLFPLRMTGYLGIATVAVSGLLLAFMFLNEWFLHWTIFTSLAFVMVGNTLLIGVVLCSVGMLALYIGYIKMEVTNRPLYIVRMRYNFDERDD